MLSPVQVGDQIVEINGEPTQGITHTRAIELIQAGGNKVLLLLRPGTGLIPDHGKWLICSCQVKNCQGGSAEGKGLSLRRGWFSRCVTGTHQSYLIVT